MTPIKTLKAAFDAIERGHIVDAADNKLPAAVVDALRRRAFSPIKAWGGSYIRSHVRYVGTREIWWFDID